MGNVDGGDFFSSDYFYKAKDNPLLYMGPVWDFDVSSGNVNYHTIYDPTVSWMRAHGIWYVRLFQDPSFKANVTAQWNALKNNGVIDDWIASIATQAKAINVAQDNNYKRWRSLNLAVWPNVETAGSFTGEVSYMTNWLKLRFSYLDSYFNTKTATATELTLGAESATYGNSVTLSATVTGGSSPTGSVTFLSNGIVVGRATLTNQTATLTVANLPTGTDAIKAVYSGDTTNALSTSESQSLTIHAATTPVAVGLGTSLQASYGSSLGMTAAVIPEYGTTAPTGSITFTFDGTASTTVALNDAGVTAYSGAPAIGTHTVVATYSGDSNYDSATSQSAKITITKGVPAIAVAASASSAFLQDSVQFTATVSSADTTPTGTVSFLDGSTPLSTATLSGGTATFSTSSLTAGTHTITVAYSGDSDFAASSSAALTETILTFTLGTIGDGSDKTASGSGANQTIHSGQIASYLLPITLSSDTTLPSAVTLTLSYVPSGISASLTPSTWTQASSTSWTLAAGSTLSASPQLDLARSSSTSSSAASRGGNLRRYAPLSLALLLLPFARRIRRTAKRLSCLGLLLVLTLFGMAAGLSGCSANSAAYSPVQLTVSAGSLTKTTMVNIAVE